MKSPQSHTMDAPQRLSDHDKRAIKFLAASSAGLLLPAAGVATVFQMGPEAPAYTPTNTEIVVGGYQTDPGAPVIITGKPVNEQQPVGTAATTQGP